MSSNIRIRRARVSDCRQLAHLRAALWPGAKAEEDAQEILAAIESKDQRAMPLIHLVAESEDQMLVGFLEAGLRSHADGCDPAQPVGFIEGWYVAEDYRRSGIGRMLLDAAEDWARSHGCLEMASDTWIDNEVSQLAHEGLGYSVVDRCVHYRKAL